MDISIYLAKVFGLYFLVVGIAGFLNAEKFRSLIIDFSKRSDSLFLSGFIALVLGILLITSHNIWSSDWRVLITILGWMTFLKGTFLLVFPQGMLNFSKRWVECKVAYSFSFLLMILLGGYFCYLGFILNSFTFLPLQGSP